MDINEEMHVQNASDTPGKITRFLFESAEELLAAIALVTILFTFLFRIITVDGESMLPNFENQDRVLITSVTSDLKQGNVVVVINALDEPIIKRVIATEGQTVALDAQNKAVLVDGEILDDTRFGVENGITEPVLNGRSATELPQVVPEGCVFVLGDNRQRSHDSRYSDIGMIDTRNILGKAVLRIYPLHKLGRV